MSKENKGNIETSEEEKWNKLQHYKCTICKEEFYFIKKEAKNKIEEDEFACEPFLTLPIFENIGRCPFCNASMRSIFTILTEKEKKEKTKQIEQKKIDEKEKLRKELEKLKEEEARLDKLRANQLEAMCREIIDDTLSYLNDLEMNLRKGEITIDRFEKIFLDGAFNIMQKDSDIYNRINKEVSLILSNSFKAGFREAILNFNSSVRGALSNLELKMENKEKKLSQEMLDEKINLAKETKEEFKEEISFENERLGDGFKRNLKRELR